MLTSEFDFKYPQRQIAYRPAAHGESRLMVLSRSGRLPSDFPLPVEKEGWAFGQTKDLARILRPGDALALNETKVIRARLDGLFPDGAICGVFAIRPHFEIGEEWECTVTPVAQAKKGMRIEFRAGLSSQIVEVLPNGNRRLRFNRAGREFLETLNAIGELPLPLYLKRAPDRQDEESYQSVFAKNPGSIAAPTASLHFSTQMLSDFQSHGVGIAKLTLHVGIGTYRSVTTKEAEDHQMHTERYTFPHEAEDTLRMASMGGGRIFAIGTTAARTLESCANSHGVLTASQGETNLFILPGYKWKVVDALLTNFHFPRSTLFMLVCSLVGVDSAKAAYSEAIRRGFRLFSYGDAMLILGEDRLPLSVV